MLLANDFCLVLHGHMHTGWFGVEQWPELYPDRKLHITAAPTLGSRETQHQLGYNCVEITREGTRFFVTVCRYLYDGGASFSPGPTLAPFSPRGYGGANL